MKKLVILACLAALCGCANSGNISASTAAKHERGNSIGISNESGSNESGSNEIYGSVGMSATVSK